MAATPPRVFAPDPSYRLAENDRAKLLPDLDAQALEVLLQHAPVSLRAPILASVVGRDISRAISAETGADGVYREHHPDVVELTRISDPQLQVMLERVWAPRWEKMSIQELEAQASDLPGLEAAKKRARGVDGVK